MKKRGFFESIIISKFTDIGRHLAIIVSLGISTAAQSESFTPVSLTKLTQNPIPLIDDSGFLFVDVASLFKYSSLNQAFNFPVTSKIREVLAAQSPVKLQGPRNTCSMFATLSALESAFQHKFDFSEQYQTYLVTTQLGKISGEFKLNNEESSIPENLAALQQWGVITESDWTYNPYRWTDAILPETETQKRTLACDLISEEQKKKLCYLGQAHPDLNPFINTSIQNRNLLKLESVSLKQLGKVSELKSALLNQQSVAVMLKVFFGAWNLPQKETLGIGPIDWNLFYSGHVPTPSSKDIEVSEPMNSGHAVTFVGYNDVERVYYFKNSWGTQNWGKNSVIQGNIRSPGYGSISYDYAHRYGSFYILKTEQGQSL